MPGHLVELWSGMAARDGGAIPRGDRDIRARGGNQDAREFCGEITFAKLRKYEAITTHELPRSRFKSLTGNLHVQQESVYRCFDGMPSLRSSPHSSSVLNKPVLRYFPKAARIL